MDTTLNYSGISPQTDPFKPDGTFDQVITTAYARKRERRNGHVSFLAQERIHGPGTIPASAYQIISGYIVLSIPMPEEARIVAILGAGDYFGRPDADTTLYQAEALTPVTARVIGAGATRTDLIAANLSLQSQIDAAFLHCAVISHFAPIDRLAEFLTRWARRYSKELLAPCGEKQQPFAIHVPLRQRQIANYLSMKSETMCRAFTELRRRNLIQTSPRSRCAIRINDFRALEALSAAGIRSSR